MLAHSLIKKPQGRDARFRLSGRHGWALSWLCLVVLANSSVHAEVSGPSNADERDINHDVIVLTNEHRIRGYVVGDARAEHVLIRTDGGTLRIRQDSIARIEEALDRRRGRLHHDDYHGHIELARWAVARNERAIALELVHAVKDHPNLDAHGLALLASLTDELVDWGEALPYYERYRDSGGKDVGLLQRLAQLSKIDNGYQRDLAHYNRKIDSITVEEGLEHTRPWRVEDPRWANPTKTDTVAIPNTGGDRVLRMQFDDGDPHKKAIVSWRENIDVRKMSVFHLLINNTSDQSFRLSIAVKVGEKWEYYESQPREIPNDQNWHSVNINLAEAVFKSAKDNWATFSHHISDLKDIRELQIQIHNGRQSGVVFFNDIGFSAALSQANVER